MLRIVPTRNRRNTVCSTPPDIFCLSSFFTLAPLPQQVYKRTTKIVLDVCTETRAKKESMDSTQQSQDAPCIRGRDRETERDVLVSEEAINS